MVGLLGRHIHVYLGISQATSSTGSWDWVTPWKFRSYTKGYKETVFDHTTDLDIVAPCRGRKRNYTV